MKTLDQHIEITPGIAGGKPRIAGHRITVENIAIWHERLGRSVDEIATEYDLSLADVHAALAYYFDHRAEIDRSIAEGEAFVEILKQQTPSKVSGVRESAARRSGTRQSLECQAEVWRLPLQ
ncbi:MAG: DUF433 domain-containing protein [Gemmataceae bacterium]